MLEASSQRVSLVSVLPSFCAASLLLYIAYVGAFVMGGGGILSIVGFAISLFLAFRIAWRLSRSESQQKQSQLFLVLPITLLAVTLGALLLSLIFFGRNWSQFFL